MLRWAVIYEDCFQTWFDAIPSEEFLGVLGGVGFPDYGVPVEVDEGPGGILVPVGKRAGVYQVENAWEGAVFDYITCDAARAIRASLKALEQEREDLQRAIEAEKKQSSILRGSVDKFNDDEVGWCGECGAPMQLVRPGKHQCIHCEERAVLHNALQEARYIAMNLSRRLDAVCGGEE